MAPLIVHNIFGEMVDLRPHFLEIDFKKDGQGDWYTTNVKDFYDILEPFLVNMTIKRGWVNDMKLYVFQQVRIITIGVIVFIGPDIEPTPPIWNNYRLAEFNYMKAICDEYTEYLLTTS